MAGAPATQALSVSSGPKRCTHPLGANFTRILVWACICSAFWISGGLAEGPLRRGLWAIAVACGYISPMFGFWLPGLGRSDTAREWTIEGGHLVERCALFVIVALGESILVTGATLAHEHHRVGALTTLVLIMVATLETHGRRRTVQGGNTASA